MGWKTLLEKALRQNRSAQNSRYFQLATVRSDGRPACRTVVYRGFLNDSEQVTICTDSRSEKVLQVADNPCAHVCWYFPISREQFRLDCKMYVVDGHDEAPDLLKARRDMWDRLSPNARAQFMWPHPGLPREDNESVYDVPGPPDGEPAAENFCMVVLSVSEVEYISLKGNKRIRFLPAKEGWSEQSLNT